YIVHHDNLSRGPGARCELVGKGNPLASARITGAAAISITALIACPRFARLKENDSGPDADGLLIEDHIGQLIFDPAHARIQEASNCGQHGEHTHHNEYQSDAPARSATDDL